MSGYRAKCHFPTAEERINDARLSRNEARLNIIENKLCICYYDKMKNKLYNLCWKTLCRRMITIVIPVATLAGVAYTIASYYK